MTESHSHAGTDSTREMHPARTPAWTDLSLRTTLLIFAFGLVSVPGLIFAFFAFTGTRAALEREIGIQLQQTAERGADALAGAVQQARSDVRTWASQDVMRDLVVGDVDKRVARFLQTLTDGTAGYLAILCTDRDGTVIAASQGEWMGRRIDSTPVLSSESSSPIVAGPANAPAFGRAVLEIGTPIWNPDSPRERIAQLVLIYDWDRVRALLDGIRAKLARLGKNVAALVVDRDGAVIGGVSFDGQSVHPSALAATTWKQLPANGYGTYAFALAPDASAELLIGAATVADAALGWSVVFVEPSVNALALVRQVRQRWTLHLAILLVVGLLIAALLARQIMQPLNEVTAATSAIAARPDLGELTLLPVRARNEVGQLTESFNRMTAALQRSQAEALAAAKLAFAGELAAMVAHEIRTPLSVMRSSAQMLAPGSNGTSDARADHTTELIDTIVAEVDRVERVVTGLIELARPLQQHLEPTHLGDLLKRAAALVAAQAERQQIRVTCDPGDSQRPALCDPEQIYQVVLNLVVNALQALPPGCAIALRALPEENQTVGFEVADDGPGLPREIRDNVFQPFVSGRAGGSGLGLAFVDRIVKAHHGRVSVRSASGQGTVFQVRLPRAEGDHV